MSGREPERRTAAVWRKRLAALFRRYQYALLVAAVGVVLMLLPAVGGGSDQETPERQAAQTVDFGTEALEGRLEDALSRMEGVGQADVVLTLRSGPGQVLAQDTKLAARETQSESSRSTVLMSRGSGCEEPVVVQQLSPQYLGALVVCSGGDDPSVRLRVVEAVGALTGLGADRISVSKGK